MEVDLVAQHKIRVLIFVSDWVEDYEAFVPIKAFEMLGLDVDVVCPRKKKGQLILSCIHDFDRRNIDGATDILFTNAEGVTASNEYNQFQAVSERYGHAILINKDFDSVKIEDYDGIFCPGGRSPETLQLNDTIIGWVKQHFDSNKPIGSLCHGIQILATAGVLNGRTCTGHPCCRCQAQMGGANWVPTNLVDTVIDGNLITAAEWTGLQGLMGEFVKATGVTWKVGSPQIAAR